MKNTRTHILKTLTLFLLIVVALTSVAGVLTVQTAYAQAAAADAPPPAAAPAAPAPAASPAPAVPAPPPADAKKPTADGTAATTPKPADSSKSPAGLGNTTVGEVLDNKDIIVMLSKVLSIVLSMISHLLWPLLMFAGGLMKSDFLYTGAIDLKLSEMWIQVRNLVNIAYVLLLLAVALYNVLGLGETVGMLELKKALPKIILGLILVNFSYAGVKVVLDVINVGTTFAFSIGRTDARLTQATMLQVNAAEGPICDTLGTGALAKSIGTDARKDARDRAIATQCSDKSGTEKDTCIKGVDAVQAPKGKSAASETAMCIPDDKGGVQINPKVKTYLKNWNVDSSLMIIAIKFMNIQDLPKVSAQASKGGIASLTINMLFSVVMFLIYAVSFITLVIVLFTRAAILWMIIIFSPVIVLNTTFPIPGVGGNTSKIIKTLIAPMLIGFVLSIGFILLSTMQNINYNGQGALTSNAPTSSIDTFQDLLVAIGSIVFLWYGIQTATSDTLSDKITGPILEGARDAGTWLAKAPFKYTPIFQVQTPQAGHHNLQDLGKIGVNLDQALYGLHHMGDKFKNDSDKKAAEIFGIDVKASVKLADVKEIEHLGNALANHPNLNALTNSPDVNSAEYKELKEAVKRINDHSPSLRTNDDKFNKLYIAVENNNTSDVATHVKGYLPKKKASPDDVSAEMKKPGSVVINIINNVKNNRPLDPVKAAAAIQTYNKALEDGGTTDVGKKAEAIAKHFTEQGVDKARRTAAMNGSRAEFAKLIPDDDANKLIDAINAAP